MLIASIGPFELAIIFLAIILIFGIERLPELAKTIAQGLKEFKKTINSID